MKIRKMTEEDDRKMTDKHVRKNDSYYDRKE